nr:protein phosphatase 2C domain-containing protein [Ktedonobacteraceae bacterium]
MVEQFKTAHNMHVKLVKPVGHRRTTTPLSQHTSSKSGAPSTPRPPTDRLVTSQPWQRRLALTLDIGADWHVGIRRKDKPNEDSLVAFGGRCIYNSHLLPFGLLIVADGMGGHANGQDASYLAVQTMLQTVLPSIVGSDALSETMVVDLLSEGVQQANMAVYQRGREIGAETGTTITAALVVDTTAFVINVGDSRTYLYREYEGLLQITRDHSRVARLVEEGKIAPDDIYTHPDRNQVYRALGEEMGVAVDWFTVSLQPGDRLLLCSDGLWEMVRNPDIERILKQPELNATQSCKALVRAALQGGGLDNISSIVAHITPALA